MRRLPLAVLVCAAGACPAILYFPPTGEGLDQQQRISLKEAGLREGVLEALGPLAPRWALWRRGRLIHVQGDFNALREVASNRKTWHAMAVGAALYQRRIPSLDQKLSVWVPTLTGKDAEATWRHVLTQASGFDYPYGDYPAYGPGKIWTYSDRNLVALCTAIARVFGLKDYHEGYEGALRAAYFDAIGMRGWKTEIKKEDDGIRLHLDLEDMGRLGLLALAGGEWNGRRLISEEFVHQLETKRTAGLLVNYNGPNDGQIGLDAKQFPEAPYGFLTWTNSAGDYYPGAGRGWAFAWGRGGSYTLWNRELSLVFAAFGAQPGPKTDGAPHILERHLTK